MRPPVAAISIALLACGCQLLGLGDEDQAGEGIFELKVDLPRAAAGTEAFDSTLAVMIAPDGVLYANGVVVNAASLEKMAMEERGKNPKIRAVIMADKDVRYQKVVEIVDIMVKSGIQEVSLGVEPQAPIPVPEPRPAPGSE